MEKLEVVDEAWDLKKILALVMVVGVLAFGLKTFVLDKNNSGLKTGSEAQSPQIQGASTIESPSPTLSSQSLQKTVENRLNDLKKEVNNINVIEVATSTPAVQKVLNDIKNLQNLPQSQAKDACLKICSSL